MHGNFKNEFPRLLLKQLLWNAARSTIEADFDRRMEEIKKVNVNAYNWLAAKQPSEWTKSHFKEGVKCDMLLNNICESLNNAILDARDKPIISLLESIRYWLMCRFYKKRESISKWKGPIHNNIVKITTKLTEVAKRCVVTRENATMFQIQMNPGGGFTVDLQGKTCTCRGFQLIGIPCGHALAAIWFCNHQSHAYIHPWYKMEAFKKTYEHTVYPVPSPDKWPKTGRNPMFPPGANILPGRPKKKRRRDADEPPPPNCTKTRRTGAIMHCSKCKKPGHSKRTCKNDAAPAPTPPT
ncbi:uncharacterized protein LOC133031967 [Cannabis sativa]|uniref:uncharacterized protein LOC133031967 n=1 Tax=Cannabis sativa TaxID=3483 RepID=UPI0029CA4008|nr:uncharacterized protein LOC133031967 [Cannabis sativa]